MQEPILSLKNITKHFGGVVALEDVSLDVAENEIVGLMGPNGAGKTTLLNIIAGTFLPDSGIIRFRGKKIIATDGDPIRETSLPFYNG